MYNVQKRSILNYKSNIYIAKKLDVVQDEYLNQEVIYDKPIKYRFNVQGISEDSEIREFGENANSMMKAVIIDKAKYIGKFKEFDNVYIDTTPNGEVKNGENADYRIYSVRNQNTSISLYFLKLVK